MANMKTIGPTPVKLERKSDWCHVCGERREIRFVELWVQPNAEVEPNVSAQRGPDIRYFRICGICVATLRGLLSDCPDAVRLTGPITCKRNARPNPDDDISLDSALEALCGIHDCCGDGSDPSASHESDCAVGVAIDQLEYHAGILSRRPVDAARRGLAWASGDDRGDS